MGEHGASHGWQPWDQSILGVVGGAYAGLADVTTSAVLVHPLTSGVTQVKPVVYGLSNSGTALFDRNFATLWGASDNVLTILDIGVLGDTSWTFWDHQQFAENVAEWIVPYSVVPVPAALWLLGSAMIGMFGLVRRKRAN